MQQQIAEIKAMFAAQIAATTTEYRLPRDVLQSQIREILDLGPELRLIPLRDAEVLEMLVAGRSNKEIGSALGIEERTVKAHVAKLMRKVGVQNRIALSVHAITHSLVTTK